MNDISMLIVTVASLILGVIAMVYLRRFQAIAKRHARIVEEERGKLSAMIASLADGVMMVDPEFNLVVTNRVLPKILGLSQVSSLSDVTAVIGGRVNIGGAIQQAITASEMVKLEEFGLGDRAIQIDIEPVKDGGNLLLGATVVFHDVSESKRLEKLREGFTAMMIHELRTPLTTIIYSVDMILSDISKMSPEELDKSVKIINSTAASMLELVNELLDVAKIEAGKFQVVKELNSLESLIEEKVTVFKPMADQKRLRLTTDIGLNLPDFPFDRRRLGQVLDNLLSNALKYTELGQIIIGAKIEGEKQILVWVRDSGEGIKQEDLPKLFSKFEQLGKGKTGEKFGTGLGLVIAKGIVEAHGGKIWAASEGLNKGTTFSFLLPTSPLA